MRSEIERYAVFPSLRGAHARARTLRVRCPCYGRAGEDALLIYGATGSCQLVARQALRPRLIDFQVQLLFAAMMLVLPLYKPLATRKRRKVLRGRGARGGV